MLCLWFACWSLSLQRLEDLQVPFYWPRYRFLISSLSVASFVPGWELWVLDRGGLALGVDEWRGFLWAILQLFSRGGLITPVGIFGHHNQSNAHQWPAVAWRLALSRWQDAGTCRQAAL